MNTTRRAIFPLVTFAVISLFFFAGAQSALAGEAFYVMVFGSQQTPPKPNYSHSFATFVRATWPGDEPCANSAELEMHTISWLPANMIVRTNALFPEVGHNFHLYETLCYAYRNCERVSMWGPYQIECDLYRRALKQKALLESGAVRYKADDMGRKPDRVSNCIHAVSSVAEGYRLRVVEPGFGEMASWAITKRFRPWIIDEDQVHTWVSSGIGLDEYPIIYRDFTSPRSGGLIIGPVFRLLGNERDLVPTYGPPKK